MSALRDLVLDLRERRLWPLAAAPPAVLLGVLVLGAGGPSSPPAAPAPPAARAPAAAELELERLAARRDRARPAADAPPPTARDPFTGLAAADAPAPQAEPRPRATTPRRPAPSASDIVKAAQRAAEANARAVTAAASASSAPAPTPPPSPQPLPLPSTAPPAPPPRPTVRVADVRLSPEGEVARARRGVPAFTPLPSVRAAVLVVRAVREGVVEAAVRPGAKVTGGRCLPRRAACRFLRVAAGRTARVVLADGTAHRLRVLRTARRSGAAASPRARCFAGALGLTASARVATSAASRWAAAAARCR